MRRELYAALQSYMRTIGRPGKNICTLSSHRATRELYAKVPSHRAAVGALCEGSMRIELRSELYAKGAVCGSTTPAVTVKALAAFLQCNGGMVEEPEGYNCFFIVS